MSTRITNACSSWRTSGRSAVWMRPNFCDCMTLTFGSSLSQGVHAPFLALCDDEDARLRAIEDGVEGDHVEVDVAPPVGQDLPAAREELPKAPKLQVQGHGTLACRFDNYSHQSGKLRCWLTCKSHKRFEGGTCSKWRFPEDFGEGPQAPRRCQAWLLA